MAFSEEDRKEIFANAGGKCEKCGTKLTLSTMEAHHKISVASGGKDIPSNGKALCHKCHTETYTYGG